MNSQEKDSESVKKMAINFVVIAAVLLALVFISFSIAGG